MKTLRKLFLNASLLLGAAGAMAQSQAQGNGDNVWSLRECVDYALAHSVTIKQQDLQTLNAQATLNQSKLQQIPSVNGSSSFGFNSGRSIDRFTNAFVQQTFNFNSWGLNANVPIFSGFQTRHTIKQNALTVEANRLDADQTRLDVSLNTAVAYLNVLNNTELVEVAQLQVQTTREQLERTDKLVKAGTLPINNLYDLQSQLANDELA
ncbi:MAG: TolC family protein, partial [Cytophagales bacterium]|nr:TolC family protein [Cytophagales bacterium]